MTEEIKNTEEGSSILPRKVYTLEEFAELQKKHKERQMDKRPDDIVKPHIMVRLIQEKIPSYELYEIRDVVDAFNAVLYDLLIQGRTVAVPHIGFFQAKYVMPHMKFIGWKNGWYAMPARVSMTFRYSKPFKEASRKAHRKIAEEAGMPYDYVEIDYVNSKGVNPDANESDKLLYEDLLRKKAVRRKYYDKKKAEKESEES